MPEGHDYEEKVFEHIKMEGERLADCRFFDCEFRNCVMEEGSLVRCNLIGCRFYNCNIVSLKTEDTQLKNCEFTDCNLIGVNWNKLLPAGNVLEPVHRLSNCFLKYNTFYKMSLKKFDFSGNMLQDCIFEDCNLKESVLKGCGLTDTQFLACDLRKADFREAQGYLIDIATNKIKDARFSFPEVIRLLDALEIKID